MRVPATPPEKQSDESKVSSQIESEKAIVEPSKGGLLSKLKESGKRFGIRIRETYRGIIKAKEKEAKQQALAKICDFLKEKADDQLVKNLVEGFLPKILINYSRKELDLIYDLLEKHPKNWARLLYLLSAKDGKNISQKITEIKSFLNTMGKIVGKIENVTRLSFAQEKQYENLLQSLSSPEKIIALNHLLDKSLEAEKREKALFHGKLSTTELLKAYDDLEASEADPFLLSVANTILYHCINKTTKEGFAKALVDKAKKLSNNTLTNEETEAISSLINVVYDKQNNIINNTLSDSKIWQILSLIDTINQYGLTEERAQKLNNLFLALYKGRENPHLHAAFEKIMGTVIEKPLEQLLETSQTLVGGRFDDKTMQAVKSIAIKSPAAFVAIQKFVEEAQKLQERRPGIFFIAVDEEAKDFTEAFMHLPQSAVLINFEELGTFVQHFTKGIMESTAATQSQVIEENLSQTYISPQRTRDVPHLVIALDESWRIAHEGHPNVQFLSDGDNIVQVDFSSEILMTHPETMETVVFRIPFPFTGEMTQTEARKLIAFVRYMADHPGELQDDAKFEAHLPFPKDQIPSWLIAAIKKEKEIDLEKVEKPYETCREYMREKILNFSKQGTLAVARGWANFNDTTHLSRGWVVREAEEFRELKDDPTSQEKAKNAAKIGNVFLLQNGQLALLPEDYRMFVGKEEFDNLATFPSTIITQVKEKLKTENSVTIGNETYAIEEKQFPALPEARYLQFTITHTERIEGEQKTFSRTKYYPLKKNQTREAVLEEIYQTKLLERDLLIAKAQFLRDRL